MKKTVRQYLVLSLLLAVSFLSLFSPLSYAATSHSIYVTPASGSYQPGNTFTVIVRGYAAATQFGAGQVNGTLTFPAGLLRVTNVSTVGNPYQVNVSATPNNANGTVAFNGQNYFGGPNDQTIQIMTVTFQTLANGTANVGFTSATKFTSSYNDYPTSLSGGSYGISTPAPATCPSGQVGTPPNCTTPAPATCPSGQIGTPPNCTTPKPNNPTPTPSTPTPTAVSPDIDPNIPTAAPAAVAPTVVDAGDLSIKNVTAKVSLKENTITWDTTLPNVTSEIQLGTSKQKLTAKPTVTKVSDTSFSATATSLVPGTRYYYTITATSTENADKKATYSGAFTTRGYPVKILVTQGGKPIANTKVQIEDDSYITDKNGSLKLELASQDYHAIVTLADKSNKSFNFTVAKKNFETGKTPDTQTFTFDMTPQAAASTDSSSPIGLMIAAGVGGLLLLGGGLFLLARRRKDEDTTQSYDVDTSSYADPQMQQPQMQEYTVNPEEQQMSTVSAIEQQYIQQPEAVVPSMAPEPAAIYEQQMMTPVVEAPIAPYQDPATVMANGYAAEQQPVEQYVEPAAMDQQYYEQPAADTIPQPVIQETTIPETEAPLAQEEVYSAAPIAEEATYEEEQPEVTQYIEHTASEEPVADTSMDIPQNATNDYATQQPAEASETSVVETPAAAPDQYLQGRPAV